MTDRRLGLGMSEDDKKIEELENIVKWVMYSVDEFLEGDEFENCEIERAAIMYRKVVRMLSEKDARITELEKELQRVKYFKWFGR